MVEANRSQFSEESNREDEWVWYDENEDWRLAVSDRGITRSSRFNVILDTDLYESRYEEGRILGNTRVRAEECVGYERAMARAAELMADAEEMVKTEKES